MAGPGQPQGLGALAAADVQHPQGGEPGQLLGELPGDQLLADQVVQPALPGEPGPGAALLRPAAGVRAAGVRAGPVPAAAGGQQVEPVVPAAGLPRQGMQTGPIRYDRMGPGRRRCVRGQGRSPRLTCGLGSRSRRICRVRIRP
ncbi:hypothetical protein GCM10010441_66110 [Kitasatospora paracochleata]